MRPIILLLANTISLLFALAMNALSGSSLFEGKTVGEVSRTYDTLFAPAGYEFAIWGPICLLLVLFVGYQWFAWRKHKQDRELQQTELCLAVANHGATRGSLSLQWRTWLPGYAASAQIGAAILLAVTSWHAIKHWETSSPEKLKRG
jgi:hypothetical protein